MMNTKKTITLPGGAWFLLLLTLLAWSITGHTQAQAPPPPAPLASLQHLLQGTWEVDTTFASGDRFHQLKVFEPALQAHAIHSRTQGTVNPETLTFGLRNEGIIAYRAADSTLMAYEFDVFGGITECVVTTQGKSIYFDYHYQGQRMRDAWVYVDENTFLYQIRAWTGTEYGQLYLSAPMIRRQAEVLEAEHR